MSSHAKIIFRDFQDGDWLVLEESKGLSEEFLAKFENHLKIVKLDSKF
jgi:tRNA (cytidine/uridine-2'-O-)-methyltransferase